MSIAIKMNVNAQEVKPTVRDLDFLLGTWDITFEIYDTHNPERGILFKERGVQHCSFDLEQNGEPMFITCRGEVTSDKGRTRTFQESIRYGTFVNTFERIGIFSNWPGTSEELLYFHSDSRKIEIKGQLKVQDGMLERYEDIYSFNEEYTFYDRRNVANFSDMPVKEFNLTLVGTGRKRN